MVSGLVRRPSAAFAVVCMVAVTLCGVPTSADAAVLQLQSFTVVATGDVLLHQNGALVRGAAAAGRADGTGFDFTGVFARVAPLIRKADLAICHLETPLAPPEGPFRGYPSFSVQPQIVDALVGAGYDTCSTASNHALDAGFAGLVRTADTLDVHHLRHVGTFRSEAESLTPHILDVGGMQVAQLSWTYGLNGIAEPDGREWTVNDFDPTGPDADAILADAARARHAGAQVVIASLHCCTEYEHTPAPAQVAIAATLLASPDIDLVIGHHAHVVQPFERVAGKWVAYGLGNHVAQQRGAATNDSVIARFTFTRGVDGRFTVTAAEAIPSRIDRSSTGVTVVPTEPNDSSFQRVARVVAERGALDAGLAVHPG
jgi:poly-gamma-glutamate synthesis protein (capsule biosynthesis protein)